VTTLIALLALGAFFVVFALLGPAERGKPCERREPGDPGCDSCPVEPVAFGSDDACPGSRPDE